MTKEDLDKAETRSVLSEQNGPEAFYPPSDKVVPLTFAVSPLRKMSGLLFSKPQQDALLLMPCCDVHTAGMRHRLDIAFINTAGFVMEAYRDVGSFHRMRHRGAIAVLERFSSCDTPWVKPGDRLGVVGMQGEVQ